MKNILVTGAAGFIGANFVEYFVNKHPDYKVVVVDKLTYAGNMANLDKVKDKISFEKADICDFEKMKEIREEKEMKQREIAEILGVDRSTYAGWETGKDTIPLRRLIEYANHYNFSLDYLFGITNKNDESYLPLKIDIDLISKNLRILRKRNSMTQEEVAKKINTSQANYAHYENSKNLIPTTFLYSLTLVYKPFSIDKLLGRKKQ